MYTESVQSGLHAKMRMAENTIIPLLKENFCLEQRVAANEIMEEEGIRFRFPLKAKGERFKGADTWEKAQATEPGPGAYEVEYLRSGAKSSLSAIALSSSQKDGIAFGSDAIRELPWE